MRTITTTIDESQLIQGCVLKNRRMQQLLYDCYAPKMYAICMRYSKNRDEANDLVQEGFIRVFTYIGTFRGEGSFEGWMRRVIVYSCLESIKKEKEKFISIDALPERYDTGYITVLDNFNVQEIIRLIRKLPKGYRCIFNLYIIEGYTHKEIAQFLGIGECTSKSQLTRAKALLRSFIEKERLLN